MPAMSDATEQPDPLDPVEPLPPSPPSPSRPTPPPTPEPAPDLKPIEARLDALAKRVDSAPSPAPAGDAKPNADQGEALARVDAQVGELRKALDAEKAEVARLDERVRSLSGSQPGP